MKYLLASYLLAAKEVERATKAMLLETSQRSKAYQEAHGKCELAKRMAQQFKCELIEPMKLDFDRGMELAAYVERYDIRRYDEALSLAEEILAN